jgi:3'(2'), 5'-bisphosphate nucleotidase
MDADSSKRYHESMLPGALAAALRAGEAILDVYDSDFQVHFKGDRSPLTEADRRAHAILTRCLSVITPGPCGAGLPVLSEEGREIPYEQRRGWDLYWLVDPLDGTKEFVKRNGDFTVNIALIDKGRPVLGVVYLPALAEVFFGVEDFGAFHADGPLVRGKGAVSESEASRRAGEVLGAAARLVPVPSGQAFSRLRIMLSRSHRSPEEDRLIAVMRAQYHSVEIADAGSSLKFCRVAQGLGDIYPRFGPTMEWDTAAGQCVLEAAGGEVVDIQSGARLLYNRPNLRNGPFIALGARFGAGSEERVAVMAALRERVP